MRQLSLIAGLLAFTGALVGPTPAAADTIAVIGTGRVGSALGPQFATLGHDIVYGSREPQRQDVQDLVARTAGNATAMQPADAARDADIVIVAVPFASVEAAVKSLGDLSGKIILDPTNAVRRDENGIRHHATETSVGQLIQGWAPDARVVKAFNTLSSVTMADPSSAGGTVTIPIVGNDPEAKAVVSELVTGIGFDVVDMGTIESAHALEQMLIVRGNAGVLGKPFNYYFRPVPAN
jgi:predicted dinucleotide-binding enzyme